LAEELPDVLEEMTAYAEVVRNESSIHVEAPTVETQLDQEAIDLLRSLGYVK
jgi:hypothetical protein